MKVYDIKQIKVCGHNDIRSFGNIGQCARYSFQQRRVEREIIALALVTAYTAVARSDRCLSIAAINADTARQV
jgi:hypothetical protein